jgi:hypothetical protein
MASGEVFFKLPAGGRTFEFETPGVTFAGTLQREGDEVSAVLTMASFMALICGASPSQTHKLRFPGPPSNSASRLKYFGAEVEDVAGLHRVSRSA